METNTEFEFVVDEEYENEKGVFTVVAIKRDEMVIRWADGEEIRTDINLQRRIQERRQWEAAMQEKKADTKKKAPQKTKAKSAAAPD